MLTQFERSWYRRQTWVYFTHGANEAWNQNASTVQFGSVQLGRRFRGLGFLLMLMMILMTFESGAPFIRTHLPPLESKYLIIIKWHMKCSAEHFSEQISQEHFVNEFGSRVCILGSDFWRWCESWLLNCVVK